MAIGEMTDRAKQTDSTECGGYSESLLCELDTHTGEGARVENGEERERERERESDRDKGTDK